MFCFLQFADVYTTSKASESAHERTGASSVELALNVTCCSVDQSTAPPWRLATVEKLTVAPSLSAAVQLACICTAPRTLRTPALTGSSNPATHNGVSQ